MKEFFRKGLSEHLLVKGKKPLGGGCHVLVIYRGKLAQKLNHQLKNSCGKHLIIHLKVNLNSKLKRDRFRAAGQVCSLEKQNDSCRNFITNTLTI